MKKKKLYIIYNVCIAVYMWTKTKRGDESWVWGGISDKTGLFPVFSNVSSI